MRCLIFLAFLGFILEASSKELSLSLDEAIGIALRENREILLSAEEVEKAKFKLKESYSLALPQINAGGTWTKTEGYYNKGISQASTQVGIKQAIYRGGKIIHTIKYSQYGIEIAQTVLDRLKLEIISKVKEAFYTLLLAQEFIDLNRQILANARRHLNLVRIRYQKGELPYQELLRREDSLVSFREAYLVSKNQRLTSIELLRNLLFLERDISIKAEGQFSYQPKEVAYEQAFLEAMENRPELKQYALEVEAAKKAVEINKADKRPTIYASGDYYSRSHSASSGGLSRNWNDYHSLSLVLSWPIFDGWATQARIEQALIDLKEKELLKEKALKDITLELRKAYLDLKNAFAKIDSTRAQLKTYKENFRSAKEKYKSGIISALELEDIWLGYRIASFNHQQALYEYLVAKARFEKATGGY